MIKATENIRSMFDGKVRKRGIRRKVDFNCTKLSEYTISIYLVTFRFLRNCFVNLSH